MGAVQSLYIQKRTVFLGLYRSDSEGLLQERTWKGLVYSVRLLPQIAEKSIKNLSVVGLQWRFIYGKQFKFVRH